MVKVPGDVHTQLAAALTKLVKPEKLSDSLPTMFPEEFPEVLVADKDKKGPTRYNAPHVEPKNPYSPNEECEKLIATVCLGKLPSECKEYENICMRKELNNVFDGLAGDDRIKAIMHRKKG
jgi:hypothetical protein